MCIPFALIYLEMCLVYDWSPHVANWIDWTYNSHCRTGQEGWCSGVKTEKSLDSTLITISISGELQTLIIPTLKHGDAIIICANRTWSCNCCEMGRNGIFSLVRVNLQHNIVWKNQRGSQYLLFGVTLYNIMNIMLFYKVKYFTNWVLNSF